MEPVARSQLGDAETLTVDQLQAELAKLGYAAGTSPTGAWYVPGDDDWELKYERR